MMSGILPTSIVLALCTFAIHAQYIPDQSTLNPQAQQTPQNKIDVAAVISRLNDVFGLGMNMSALIAKYKPTPAPQDGATFKFEFGKPPSANGNPNNVPNQFGSNMPNQFAPNAPNQFAPNAPNQFAPNAPNQFAPNLANQFAPNVQNYGNGFNAGPNNMANQFVPNMQSNGFVSQNGIPNNLPNQLAPSPQNNGFLSQNGIPNNFPNQLAPMPQNSGSLFNINGGAPPNQPSNTDMLRGFPPNQQSNINTDMLKGFGPNNSPNNVPNQFAPNIQGNGFVSQNGIPNNLPNQLAPAPQTNVFLSQNGIPNNFPNQLAPMPQNSGSLFNINGGAPPNQPSNTDMLRGFPPNQQSNINTDMLKGFGPNGPNGMPNGLGQPSEVKGMKAFPMDAGMLKQMFGANSQSAAGGFQNGLFNGMPMPKDRSGFAPSGQGGAQSLFQMFQNMGTNNKPDQMRPDQNTGNAQSLFQMYQQMGNKPQSEQNRPDPNAGMFQKTFDTNYNGMNNVMGVNPEQRNQQDVMKNQQQNFEQQLQQQQQQQEPNLEQSLRDQIQQEQHQNNPQKNKEVDDFIKRMFGQDFFENAKKGLEVQDGKINDNQYPATEESLFQKVTDEYYEGIFNNKSQQISTDNYKRFNILKGEHEPIESVKKKIMKQNEWVKADENKLNAYFSDVKKAHEDRTRDEMYGRVKREVIIDETINENEKTTRRTHIFEDIEVGLRDWINFGRQTDPPESAPNTTVDAESVTTIRSRSKRDVGNKHNYEDIDEQIASFANRGHKNQDIENIIDNCADEIWPVKKLHGNKGELHNLRKDLRQKREAVSYENIHRFGNTQMHDLKETLNMHNEVEGMSNEDMCHYIKDRKHSQNDLLNHFIDYIEHDEENVHKKKIRPRREVNEKDAIAPSVQAILKEDKTAQKISRQKRQSKADPNDMDLLTSDLKKRADKYSRLPYNEIFPEILKDFDNFRETTYSKALRKAYRANGWAAKEFSVPESPREKLPQVFRHFKYVSKTSLEEYYFIMMLKLPKLVKLYERMMNIVNRGFVEPTNGQLQGYINREYAIDKDFADFSKILRSKIFNAYLDFEDRYNEESPKFFNHETMPPFNKDPTAPPEMEKFKEVTI